MTAPHDLPHEWGNFSDPIDKPGSNSADSDADLDIAYKALDSLKSLLYSLHRVESLFYSLHSLQVLEQRVEAEDAAYAAEAEMDDQAADDSATFGGA